MVSHHPELKSTLHQFQLGLTDDCILLPVSHSHLQDISRSHCLKWKLLPVALEMKNPRAIVHDIEHGGKPESEMRSDFFSEWQSEKGSNASYKWLINALLEINCKQDAEHVCALAKEQLNFSRGDNNHSQSSGIAKENLARVKGCFASLVKRVSIKLSTLDIDMRGFRLFIAALFPPGNYISNAASIIEIFSAITHCRLWDYSFYSPIEEICKEFGADDSDLTEYVSSYKAELAGFKATTKIIDFIEECNDEEDIAGSDESIGQYIARYDKKYYRRLAVKLKSPVTENSLEYIDHFWRSVADLFLLPSLPVLLETIHKGCTEITWCISSIAASKIESSHLLFYRLLDVMQVKLDHEILFIAEEDDVARLVQKLQNQVQSKNSMIAIKNEIILQLNHEVSQLLKKQEAQDRHIQELRRELCMLNQSEKQLQILHTDCEMRLREKLQIKEEEINGLKNELKRLQEVEDLHHDFQLAWLQGPDMPIGMSSYVQSVVVQDSIYVGGGSAGSDSVVIMEYNTSSMKWTELLPYIACDFGMAAIENQLVLVGGLVHGAVSKVLSVWRADLKKFTHPYPKMPTAHCSCSVASYNEWLVVVGGWANNLFADDLSSLEILNTETKQWYSGPPAPTPWVDMKTAVVGDTCYFLGGSIDEWPTNMVYCMSFPALVTYIHNSSDLSCYSNKKDEELWREITELPVKSSCPLSFNGHLLAIGGSKEDLEASDIAMTDILLYQPETEEWVKVGDMPAPRYNCTCSAVTDREIVIVGGSDYGDVFWHQKMDFARVNYNQS